MSNLEVDIPIEDQNRLDKKAITVAASLLGDRWLLLIISELLEGTKRFSQIQEGLKKITPQTLSGRLKLMEHCGIVTRFSYNEIPPRVEYTLTEKGQAISEILKALSNFGSKYLLEEAEAIEQNQCPGEQDAETKESPFHFPG